MVRHHPMQTSMALQGDRQFALVLVVNFILLQGYALDIVGIALVFLSDLL